MFIHGIKYAERMREIRPEEGNNCKLVVKYL